MKKNVTLCILLFLKLSLFSSDLSGTYILDLSSSWVLEIVTLEKIGNLYLFLYDAPTSDGMDSYSAYEIGEWDGEQIIFENIDTIYAIKPQPDGTLHYYAIKDPYEFPGKDFRPLTEADFQKIVDLK